MIIKCRNCNIEFSVTLSRRKRKFCSHKCSTEYTKKLGLLIGNNHPQWKGGLITKVCDYCSKDFNSKPARERKYCSRKCMGLAQSGKNNPMFGIHHSYETKQKLRELRIGKHHTVEARCKLSKSSKGENNPNYGKHSPLSDEAKRKISNALKGKFLGENNQRWKGGLKLARKRTYKRLKNDLKSVLRNRISGRMRESLASKKNNKNGRHWEGLVGYNVEELKKRLELTMPEEYTWQDFLNGKLHIDHIIPISAFNFSSPEHLDFQRCWDLNNLQLLPAQENLIKHNKLKESFQPSFKL